jgi:integrase/recombinase XerC
MDIVATVSWSNPSKRKLNAFRAAQERDESALLDLLQAYLSLKSQKRTTLSPKTLETYRLGVRDFLAWAWPPHSLTPQIQILKATSDDIDHWIALLQTKGSHLTKNPEPLRPSSIATYLAAVRAFYRALEWAGAAEIPKSVSTPRDPTPAHERRPALPIHLYKQLVAHLEGTETEVYRDRILVRLLGEAGLRISEAIHLTIHSISLAERLLKVKGKGSKIRSVPVSKSLATDINNWLRMRSAFAKSDHILINLGNKNQGGSMTPQHVRRILDAHYRALDFPKHYSGAHMLRHTAGTRFYKASKDLHATARLLGHTNINTSTIYAKMDLEGLFDVVDKLDE